jgi:hypothetical protein
MAIAQLREAISLLTRMPLLWLPGLVAGLLAATLWILLNIAGTFFTSRILVIFGLVLLLFITGMLAVLRNNSGNFREMMTMGIQYYFRVLLPQMVIIFGVLLIFALMAITMALITGTPDMGLLSALTLGIMIPTFIFTFFYDTAAVFEDKKVFESIQRSIILVNSNAIAVLKFFVISAVVSFAVIFSLMIVWEGMLYENLEPLTRYNETQIQSFTPDQLVAMIGPDGMWITAIVLFIGLFVLIPVLYTYKACVFKTLAGKTVSITQQPVTGEYDSKGRWYKY